MNIPQKFQKAVDTIKHKSIETGMKVYIVGGSVRDILLGKEPKDLDILVDAPNGGIKFAKKLADNSNHSLVCYPRFGTAMLTIEDIQVEFVMPRSETYDNNSRKPDVEFTTLKEDAIRRDFTINALYLDICDENLVVTDPTGRGLADLKDGIIRSANDKEPFKVFYEDPLRMLRAYKFASRFGYIIEPKTEEEIRRNSHRLEVISKERIREEFSAILLSEIPSEYIDQLVKVGLMTYIAPELLLLLKVKQPEEHHIKDVWNHTLGVVDHTPPVLELRLAALLHDVAKPLCISNDNGEIHFYRHEEYGMPITRNVVMRLKYPKDVCEKVAFMVRNHMRVSTYEQGWSDSAIRRFIRDMGEHLGSILTLSRADITSMNPKKVQRLLANIDSLENRINEVNERDLKPVFKSLLDGNELMDLLGKPAGNWITKLKEFLIQDQLEDPSVTKDELKRRILENKYQIDNL